MENTEWFMDTDDDLNSTCWISSFDIAVDISLIRLP